eukprot:403345063
MSQPVAYHRSPCPGRIFEDLGVGFSIGCLGGSLFYFGKGMWNAPRKQRLISGLMHVRNRAPFLGGSFAMWGGVFSSMDCLLIYYRQKDDPWNAVVAGFITGGVLAIRGGLNVAFKNAMMGGVILALIEGVSTIVTSISMRRQYQMMEEMQKAEMERMQKQMRRGGADPWAVDYTEQLAKGQAAPESESLIDKAKSFSF